MTPYEKLVEWRKAHPRKTKWASNTYITEQHDENDLHCFVVKYHNTNIVRVYEDRIMFNTGGWNTVTTRQCMNRFMPDGVNLYQREYLWYVDAGEGWVKVNRRWDLVLNSDGSWGIYVR